MKQKVLPIIAALGCLLFFASSQATPPSQVPAPPPLSKGDKNDLVPESQSLNATIKARQKAKRDVQQQWDALMTDIAWYQAQQEKFRAIGGTFDPDNPVNRKTTQLMNQRADFLADSFKQFKDMFPPGTTLGSNADPEIWMATTDFANANSQMLSTIRTMRRDWGAVDLNKAHHSCNSCHARFGGPAEVKK